MPLSIHVPGLSPESKRILRGQVAIFKCHGCSVGATHAAGCQRAAHVGEPRAEYPRAIWREPCAPDCQGWLHMEDPEEVQRCDECGRFSSDHAAQLAHARECGCTWGSSPAAVPSRGPMCAPCGDAGRVGDAECFECRPVDRDLEGEPTCDPLAVCDSDCECREG